jgi:hypothetical protein
MTKRWKVKAYNFYFTKFVSKGQFSFVFCLMFSNSIQLLIF